MGMKKHFLSTIVIVSIMFCFTGMSINAHAADPLDIDNPVADMSAGSSGITWMPKVAFAEMVLTIAKPDGSVFSKTFPAGSNPSFELYENYMDGTYTYELLVVPVVAKRVREGVTTGSDLIPGQKPMTQTGYFTVRGGSLVIPGGQESLSAPMDVLHYDDVIITGSLCVGFDCQDGESFGFDTIILKEHNLRIYFNDTSYTASYPTNSWRITINDSTNGGASYFSVDDVDDGTSIFKIEAGAPSNSLYVEDYGRVGLGTSTPVVELHIKDSDTPTLRLEQDSSGGWTAQTWDVAGNESNFFVRDATNGSKLPFRIQPSTPSSTLCLKADGKVGIGTWSPAFPLELEVTGTTATFALERTDGSTAKISAGASAVQFGSQSNHNVKIYANNTEQAVFTTGGRFGLGVASPSYMVHLSGGAYSDGAQWLPASSIEYKENVKDLNSDEAMAALEGLNPVKFNYKINKTEEYLGFIAEYVPDLVATNNRKAVSPMDVVAVLTKVVQQQQKTISQLNDRISQLEKKSE